MNTHLRNARIKKRLTQKQLGQLVGRDQACICCFEKGKYEITKDMAPKLAAALDLPVLTVLYGPRLARQLSAIGNAVKTCDRVARRR